MEETTIRSTYVYTLLLRGRKVGTLETTDAIPLNGDVYHGGNHYRAREVFYDSAHHGRIILCF